MTRTAATLTLSALFLSCPASGLAAESPPRAVRAPVSGESLSRPVQSGSDARSSDAMWAPARLAQAGGQAAPADLEIDWGAQMGADAADGSAIRAFLEQGDTEGALARARDFHARAPASAVAANLLGLVHQVRGELEEARRLYAEADRLDPGNLGANLVLAKLAMDAGDLDAAEGPSSRALEYHPEAIEAMLARAVVLLGKGNREDAEKLLRQAVETHPDALSARDALARLLIEGGRATEAAALWEEAVKAHPADQTYLIPYAMAQLAAGAYDQALATARRLIELNPNAAGARHLAARAMLRLKDVKGARAALEEAVALDPEGATARLDLAQVLLAERDLEGARKQLEWAAKAVPEHATAKRLSGVLALADGQTERALALLEDAYRLQPSQDNVLVLSDIALRAGRIDRALAVQEQWLAGNEKDLLARFAYASTLGAAKRIQDANREYERILTEDPDNVMVLNNLAWNLRETDAKRALALAEKSYGFAPASLAVLDTLAAIQVAAREYKAAERTIAQGLNQHPGATGLQYWQAELLAATGRAGEARQRLQELLKSQEQFPERAEAEALLKRLQPR